jgi:hypothetical protein
VRIELTHKGFADLSLTTWVPRLDKSSITKFADTCVAAAFRGGRFSANYYFFTGCSICASRKNRADSSGGVGLM